MRHFDNLEDLLLYVKKYQKDREWYGGTFVALLRDLAPNLRSDIVSIETLDNIGVLKMFDKCKDADVINKRKKLLEYQRILIDERNWRQDAVDYYIGALLVFYEWNIDCPWNIEKGRIVSEKSKPIVKETVVVNSDYSDAKPLLRRAFLCLEYGEWNKADKFCERVLDHEPENAEAYLGKLMAELHVHKQEELVICKQPFDQNKNYQKAIRFGGDRLSSSLKGYITHIKKRNEINRLSRIYNNAVKAMNTAGNEAAYKAVAADFKMVSGFKDADTLAELCLKHAEACSKDAIYEDACANMSGENVSSYEYAIDKFQTIPGWKNADELVHYCRSKIKVLEEYERHELMRKKEQDEKARKRLYTALAIAVLIIMFVLIHSKILLPQFKLNKAKKLIDSADYEEAYHLLDGLNYMNSDELLESIKTKYQKLVFSRAYVGSYICFGSYEQDNDISNGKEDIEWLVLERDGDEMLVISRFALDCQRYNSSVKSVSWETCSLRSWLNEEFFGLAFSSDERDLIKSTIVTADVNPSYETFPENNTNDKVFLLSIKEVNEYFTLDSERQCYATAYARSQGADMGNSSRWWLRSSGFPSFDAAYVNADGVIDEEGKFVYYFGVFVRPTLWIDFGE